MAATTITQTGSSDQYIKIANTLAYANTPVIVGDYDGKVRCATFTLTFASQAAGSYGLVRIPKGVRILGVKYAGSATFGASATIAIGVAATDATGLIDALGSVSDDTAFFRAAATNTSTAEQSCGDTVALHLGYVTEKELYLTLTVAVAALPSSGTVVGRITYVGTN